MCLTQDSSQRLLDVSNDVIEIQDFDVQKLFAAEGEQLPGQIGRPLRSLDYLLHFS